MGLSPRSRVAIVAWLFQALLLLALVAAIAWMVSNTLAHLRERGIHAGFDFLWQPAGFEIGESWLSYESSQPFWRAFVVGLANTVRVAVPGIVLATLLGTLIGLARLSHNLLLRALSTAYVELLRNVPLLVQLLMWYFALTELLHVFDSRIPTIGRLKVTTMSPDFNDGSSPPATPNEITPLNVDESRVASSARNCCGSLLLQMTIMPGPAAIRASCTKPVTIKTGRGPIASGSNEFTVAAVPAPKVTSRPLLP